MPRVIHEGGPYERIDSRSWLEKDYERLVLERSEEIFPRWKTVAFAPDVTAPGGVTKRPDLALIDLHYRQWWVVEVELQHHSLQGHVLPQVEVFAEARFTSRHAKWIAEKHPELDPARLEAMMIGDSPRVLVVADAPVGAWHRSLSEVGVELAIVEPFRNAHGQILIRVNGFEPEPLGKLLTRCERDLSRMWRVLSPAALPDPVDGRPLEITYQGVVSEWRALRLLDALMLRAVRGNPLADLSAVNLMLREDLTLEFVDASRGRKGKK